MGKKEIQSPMVKVRTPIKEDGSHNGNSTRKKHEIQLNNNSFKHSRKSSSNSALILVE